MERFNFTSKEQRLIHFDGKSASETPKPVEKKESAPEEAEKADSREEYEKFVKETDDLIVTLEDFYDSADDLLDVHADEIRKAMEKVAEVTSNRMGKLNEINEKIEDVLEDAFDVIEDAEEALGEHVEKKENPLSFTRLSGAKEQGFSASYTFELPAGEMPQMGAKGEYPVVQYSRCGSRRYIYQLNDSNIDPTWDNVNGTYTLQKFAGQGEGGKDKYVLKVKDIYTGSISVGHGSNKVEIPSSGRTDFGGKKASGIESNRDEVMKELLASQEEVDAANREAAESNEKAEKREKLNKKIAKLTKGHKTLLKKYSNFVEVKENEEYHSDILKKLKPNVEALENSAAASKKRSVLDILKGRAEQVDTVLQEVPESEQGDAYQVLRQHNEYLNILISKYEKGAKRKEKKKVPEPDPEAAEVKEVPVEQAIQNLTIAIEDSVFSLSEEATADQQPIADALKALNASLDAMSVGDLKKMESEYGSGVSILPNSTMNVQEYILKFNADTRQFELSEILVGQEENESRISLAQGIEARWKGSLPVDQKKIDDVRTGAEFNKFTKYLNMGKWGLSNAIETTDEFIAVRKADLEKIGKGYVDLIPEEQSVADMLQSQIHTLEDIATGFRKELAQNKRESKERNEKAAEESEEAEKAAEAAEKVEALRKFGEEYIPSIDNDPTNDEITVKATKNGDAYNIDISSRNGDKLTNHVENVRLIDQIGARIIADTETAASVEVRSEADIKRVQEALDRRIQANLSEWEVNRKAPHVKEAWEKDGQWIDGYGDGAVENHEYIVQRDAKVPIVDLPEYEYDKISVFNGLKDIEEMQEFIEENGKMVTLDGVLVRQSKDGKHCEVFNPKRNTWQEKQGYYFNAEMKTILPLPEDISDRASGCSESHRYDKETKTWVARTPEEITNLHEAIQNKVLTRLREDGLDVEFTKGVLRIEHPGDDSEIDLWLNDGEDGTHEWEWSEQSEDISQSRKISINEDGKEWQKQIDRDTYDALKGHMKSPLQPTLKWYNEIGWVVNNILIPVDEETKKAYEEY